MQFNASIWNKISDDAKDFISSCLKKDFKSRPFTSELVNHVWLQKQVKNPIIEKEVQLDIAENLKEFRVISIVNSLCL